MRVGDWIILCFAIAIYAYVAQKDYHKHQYAKDHVSVSMWICSVTKIIMVERTRLWNESLFSLPGLRTFAYKGNKPIENLFAWTDTVTVPYSSKAAAMDLHPEWKGGLTKHSLCLYVNDIPFICNLFDGCWFWPFFAPWKFLFNFKTSMEVFLFTFLLHQPPP